MWCQSDKVSHALTWILTRGICYPESLLVHVSTLAVNSFYKHYLSHQELLSVLEWFNLNCNKIVINSKIYPLHTSLAQPAPPTMQEGSGQFAYTQSFKCFGTTQHFLSRQVVSKFKQVAVTYNHDISIIMAYICCVHV